MSEKKMVSVVAVGLMFSTGGHELVIERFGAAHAAEPTVFVGLTNDHGQICETVPDPSSGACSERGPAYDQPAQFQFYRDNGGSWCAPSVDSSGSSGFFCLPLGVSDN